jgi:hypothetical protein
MSEESASFDESHWQYYVILGTGIRSSLFQSFAPAGRMLDVFGSNSRCVPGNPVSSIKNPVSLQLTDSLIFFSNGEFNNFMQRSHIL